MSACILSEGQLRRFIPTNKYVSDWYEALSILLPQYDINTPLRVAAFLAQCGHESGGFVFLRENLNYRAESLMKFWPKHFPTIEIARQYERKPVMIANRAYANRMGNGNEASGDGWRYCGRGLIQLTGKDNYEEFAQSIETPVEEIPDYLATFEGATQSACWFWETNRLNREADVGDLKTMTRKINGGYNGLEDRVKHYHHALEILNG